MALCCVKTRQNLVDLCKVKRRATPHAWPKPHETSREHRLRRAGHAAAQRDYPQRTAAAPYLPASILALKAGGLTLMFGMTIFAGLAEITVSRLFRPLRPFFSPEIAGFVVVMIGVTIGTLGFRSLFGAGLAAPEGAAQLGVGAITLFTMVPRRPRLLQRRGFARREPGHVEKADRRAARFPAKAGGGVGSAKRLLEAIRGR